MFSRDVNGYLVWRLISQLAAPILSQPFSDAHHAYRQVVEGVYLCLPKVVYLYSFHAVDDKYSDL